jgi:hypothetical protein
MEQNSSATVGKFVAGTTVSGAVSITGFLREPLNLSWIRMELNLLCLKQYKVRKQNSD